ncbi:hypothetical protein HQ563_13080, partial [bacterium]|nr:hypothetical protein [bacterium]
KNRTAATGFPLYYHYKVSRAFLDAANADSWASLSLSAASVSASAELRVFGSQNSEHAYLYARDVDNGFGTGSEPGDIAGRTLSGKTITLSGMSPDTEFEATYYDTWDATTPLGTLGLESGSSSAAGSLTLHLPSFQRDLAVVVGKPVPTITPDITEATLHDDVLTITWTDFWRGYYVVQSADTPPGPWKIETDSVMGTSWKSGSLEGVPRKFFRVMKGREK